MSNGECALWIGGPPGSGKTTVASRIARRRGLRWYNADAHTWEHRDRAIAAGNAAAIRFEELPVADRWTAPVAEMLSMSLHHDRGQMIAADVQDLPPAPLTIAEGTPITPAAVGVSDRTLWLLPSKEVQQARLTERGLRPGVLQLYQALVHEIEEQVHECGGRTLIVDGRHTIEETVAAVEELFADELRAAPTAQTPEQRRELLRYANRAVVQQIRGFFSRPWADGDGSDVVKPFACECGAADCTAEVPIAIGDFPPPPDRSSPPVLAPGHGAA